MLLAGDASVDLHSCSTSLTCLFSNWIYFHEKIVLVLGRSPGGGGRVLKEFLGGDVPLGPSNP